MTNETVSFVLITALFGMAVVALFLTLLSFVMHLIRTTDEALANRAGRAGEGATGLPRPSGPPGAAGLSGANPSARAEALPLWAVAAAAVYLDAEHESARHLATPWTARSGR